MNESYQRGITVRLTEILIIAVIGILFFVGVPFPKSAGLKGVRQEQQETTSHNSTFIVVFRSKESSQEDTADISWLKKAADVGVKNKLPYFNVLEQRSFKQYSKKADTELTTIEGIVEYNNDPMGSDYDAREILSLITDV